MGKSGSETLQRWYAAIFYWKDIRLYQQGQHMLGSKSPVSYKRQQFPALSPEGFDPLINGMLSG